MKSKLFAVMLGGAATVASVTSAPAYPVDCAILLCLAGGFPASTECAAAKAEFIRRVTPWPIEPPLQIWRCPMGGGMPSGPNTGADIDVTGRAFDFIRALKVYTIDYQAFSGTTNDGDRDVCHIARSRNMIGEYGSNGEFAWSGVSVSEIPEWTGFDLPVGSTCKAEGHWRGVSIGYEALTEDGGRAFQSDTFRY